MTHTTEYVGCPDCGAPAEIVDRFVLDSTDGPLEHLKLWCVTGHWFTVLTENVPARTDDPGWTQRTVGGRSAHAGRSGTEEEVQRWTAH